jgi:hypothetical protein
MYTKTWGYHQFLENIICFRSWKADFLRFSHTIIINTRWLAATMILHLILWFFFRFSFEGKQFCKSHVLIFRGSSIIQSCSYPNRFLSEMPEGKHKFIRWLLVRASFPCTCSCIGILLALKDAMFVVWKSGRIVYESWVRDKTPYTCDQWFLVWLCAGILTF